ncbi:hypothetical protein OV320_2632 [Actinobacteria bacterium OV320]|nr:hypothetical protein OV320_2632 [Actinobacteria bacterium OV320]
MPKFQVRSPVRLRRLAGDRRLYITSDGSTDAGYLAESSLHVTNEDFPYLHLELEEHPYDLYSDGTDAATYDFPAYRLLAADVDALTTTAKSNDYALLQLLHVLEALRPDMGTVVPECGHEDVIEVPQVGDTQTPGICTWCPTPLVRLNDEWIPA